MWSKPLALLLLGAAWAQQQPSIEDMLAETSNTIHAPNAVSAAAMAYPGAAPATSAVTAPGTISGALGVAPSAALAPAAPSPSGPAPQGQIGPQFPPAPGASGPPSSSALPGAGGMGAMPGGAGGMGAMLGAMTQAMGGGGTQSTKKDMFGRKPSNPADALSGLFGGGGKGGGKGGGASPMASNPIMDSLLKSVESKMPMNQKIAEKNGGKKPISQESRLIVSGLIEAFMHKAQLNPGEKSCLENNLATLTADVVGTVEDIIHGVKAIMEGKTAMNASTLEGTPGLAAESQGTLVSAALDGTMKLTSLVTLATTLMKNCVQGDTLEMLKAVGANFVNAQYLGHRLLVSGVDIAHRLSDAIIAFEGRDYHRFGQDIGISIRKILLSNSTRGSRLPEGVPEEAIIQETTEGLMQGFFVSGAGMEITDSADPDVDIQLDLHNCIAGNHEFFKEIWLAMWNLIAELSVNAGNHDFQNPFTNHNAGGSQPKWMGEIMIAMMQVPSALARCNIDEEMQKMLMDAIKSIKYLQVHFLFPRHVITADEATSGMAKAVEAWTNWDFKGFGAEIGKLLREFVMLMYPQQYSVDAHGRLRRQLIGESSKVPALKVAGLTFGRSFGAFIVGGVALSMLVALVAVRGIRSVSSHSYEEPSFSDAEGGIFLDEDLEVE